MPASNIAILRHWCLPLTMGQLPDSNPADALSQSRLQGAIRWLPQTTWPIMRRAGVRALAQHLAWSAADQATWESLCAAQPRLHDGPAVCAVLDAEDRLSVFQSSYRFVAVQQARHALGSIGSPRLRLVGIKALVMVDSAGPDGSRGGGARRLLVGLRRDSHRMYPGMWEAIPAGGVDALPTRHDPSDGADHAASLSPSFLLEQLRREAREEIAAAIPDDASIRCLGLLIDDPACSVDVVMQVIADKALATSLHSRIDHPPSEELPEHHAVELLDEATLTAWLSPKSTVPISPALHAMAPGISW